MEDLYHSNSFLKAIQNKDYEKAFTYLDVKSVYDRLIYGYVFNLKLDDLHEVKIDDEIWYVDESLYLNEYQTYINSSDSMWIWLDLILRNSSHQGMTAIPKEKMSKKLIDQLTSLGEGIIIYNGKGNSDNNGMTYYLWKDDMGREYYVPEQRQQQTEEGAEILDIFMELRCIPKKAYDDLMRRRKEEEGFTISSFDINPYYYYNEPNREWTITASLKLYQDGIFCEEQYQYGNVKQNVRNSLSIDSTNDGITLHSSYLGLRLEEPMERAINYLGLTEDVDNYFGY